MLRKRWGSQKALTPNCVGWTEHVGRNRRSRFRHRHRPQKTSGGSRCADSALLQPGEAKTAVRRKQDTPNLALTSIKHRFLRCRNVRAQTAAGFESEEMATGGQMNSDLLTVPNRKNLYVVDVHVVATA